MNKQSLITILITVLMSIDGTKAFAQDIEVANADGVTIYYNWINDHKELSVTWLGSSCSAYPNRYSGNLVIPESVVYEGNTYSVTSIGSDAFGKCSALTSVTIPNSVTSIGDGAFKYCSSLASVTIPNSVTSIGGGGYKGSFAGCSNLANIDIPNSVTSIGRDAFDGTAWYNNQPNGLVYAGKVAYNYKGEMPKKTSISLKDGTLGIADNAFSRCSSLVSITIPNSVTSIGNSAFEYCSNLTSIDIPNSVKSIGSGAFYECKGLTSVTISNSVTTIDRGAFSGCSGLTSVSIPNSVTTIGESAFYACSELSIIDIPNSVTYIGLNAFYGTAWINNQEDGLVYAGKVVYQYKGEMPDNTVISIKDGTVGIAEWAFWGCSRMISVNIPNSVTSIGSGAFQECSGLTSIDIPNSVTSIGYSAFSYCSGLTTIDIPNSVTSIEVNLFFQCSSLTSITIPKSLTYIEPGAFSGCCALTSIEVENDNPKYDSRNNCNAIIETSSNTLIVGCKNTTFPSSVTSIGVCAFSGHAEITTISIPDNVTSIGLYAFSGCSGLTSIDIPNSVTFIGGSAFSDCCSLSSVIIPNSVTSIDGSAFGNCWALSDFYCWANNVPSTSIHAFEMTPCNKATLHVPVGSVDAYMNTSPWSQFGKIVVLEGITIPGDVTGNGVVDDEDIAFVLECIMNNTFDTKADINHDSKVNVADLVEIVNIIKNNGAQ